MGPSEMWITGCDIQKVLQRLR